MQYIRLNTNNKYINALYNTNKIINKYKNLLLRFGLVRFGFEKAIRNPIRSGERRSNRARKFSAMSQPT
jgi:hypothetical protein